MKAERHSPQMKNSKIVVLITDEKQQKILIFHLISNNSFTPLHLNCEIKLSSNEMGCFIENYYCLRMWNCIFNDLLLSPGTVSNSL